MTLAEDTRLRMQCSIVDTGVINTDNTQSVPRQKILADFISPWKGLLLSVLGIILYLSDIGSDLSLAINYFIGGDMKWGAWTLAFFLLPQLGLFIWAMCVFTDKYDGRAALRYLCYPVSLYVCLFHSDAI